MGGDGERSRHHRQQEQEQEQELSREAMTLSSLVKRKKDFKHMESIRGRWVNVLEGLELHEGVFSAAEQHRIVDCVLDFQQRGRRGLLRG